MVHEVLGGDSMNPNVPLIFCGEVDFFHRRDYFLLERNVNVLINVIDSTPSFCIAFALDFAAAELPVLCLCYPDQRFLVLSVYIF